MAKDWDMGICNEKSGFLFNHDCYRAPVGNCSSCEKPVCDEHSYYVDDVVLCTRCVKKSPNQPQQGQGQQLQSRRNRGRDSHYYYYDDPYFYGGYYYGYGYHHGYHGSSHHDPHDFTEADATSLTNEADEGFESDMSES